MGTTEYVNSPAKSDDLPELTNAFERYAARLNRIIEIGCALLIGLMVLIVWLGVINRYFIGADITWTEELARYLMIWSALLAISCGASRREHIGFNLLVEKLPATGAFILANIIDLLSILFFIYLVVYGTRMTIDGAHQFATIFGINMVLPFAAVPVSAALTAIQITATSPLVKNAKNVLSAEVTQ